MRHPEGPRFHQRAEGSPAQHFVQGDPSLRLKNGSTRDDAISKIQPDHGGIWTGFRPLAGRVSLSAMGAFRHFWPKLSSLSIRSGMTFESKPASTGLSHSPAGTSPTEPESNSTQLSNEDGVDISVSTAALDQGMLMAATDRKSVV